MIYVTLKTLLKKTLNLYISYYSFYIAYVLYIVEALVRGRSEWKILYRKKWAW